MFRQEINLYTYFDALTKDISPFTRNKLLLSWMLFIFFTFISYGYSLWHIRQLTIKESEIIKKSAEMQQISSTIKEKYPQAIFEKNTDSIITAMEVDMKEQKQLIAIIESNSPFSAYLETLAAIIIQKVWLTNISIQKNQEEIVLKGETTNKLALNNFLQAIQNNNFFSPFKMKSQEIGTIKSSDPASNVAFQATMIRKSAETINNE